MTEKKKKLFSANDFDKQISVGEQLVFDKQDLNTVKIDLIWDCPDRVKYVGDLDVCAFMLGALLPGGRSSVHPLSLASLDSSPSEGSLWRRDKALRNAKASPR